MWKFKRKKPMKNPQDVKQTLCYQQMVATLKSRPPYVQEAALLKELANGKQWRIDAVVEAIDAKKRNWGYIDTVRVFEQAATYGRLATIKNLSESDYFKEMSKYNCSTQILAAFDAAVLHGHFQVADYCKSLGADPQYMIGGKKPQAMPWAVEEGNERKMDYLIKAGEDPSDYLYSVVMDGNKKTLDFLLDKGADINYASEGFFTPFLAAIKSQDNELAHYLLKRGADPKNSPAAEEAMYTAVGDNNIEMVKTMIGLGMKPDEQDMELAQCNKHQEMVNLVSKYVAPKSSNPKPAF
jgi:hypothetical protein